MKSYVKFFVFSLLAIFGAAPALQAGPNLQSIRCGDHWFEINITLTQGGDELVVSGDSVVGEDLVYNPLHEQRYNSVQEVTEHVFAFGAEGYAELLTVAVTDDSRVATGTYRSENGWDTLMNCYVD